MNRETIIKEIAELYPYYDLTDNLLMVYGPDFEKVNKYQVLRLIVRNIIELGSINTLLNQLDNVGIEIENKDELKVLHEYTLKKVEKYLIYVIACEGVKYRLFKENDLYSYHKFFIEIGQLIGDIDEYSQFVKKSGYRGVLAP